MSPNRREFIKNSGSSLIVGSAASAGLIPSYNLFDDDDDDQRQTEIIKMETIDNKGNRVKLEGPDETVGAIPVRQDITVLPADNPPRELKLGWYIYELAGWAECDGEVANIDTGEIYSSKDWTDFDWEIYNRAVHNRYPDHKPTKRNRVEKLLKKLATDPEKFAFAEMHFFIQDKGKWCGWEYNREKKHAGLFNRWLDYCGAGEKFFSHHHKITAFPQHESKNNIQCKIYMMTKALEFLKEKDPNGYLGCYFNLAINDKEHELHCYDVIKKEIETVDEKAFQWFAAYGEMPTIKDYDMLRKGFDTETYHKKYQSTFIDKDTLPEKWKRFRYGTVIINDYATSKVIINGEEASSS